MEIIDKGKWLVEIRLKPDAKIDSSSDSIPIWLAKNLKRSGFKIILSNSACLTLEMYEEEDVNLLRLMKAHEFLFTVTFINKLPADCGLKEIKEIITYKP